MKSDQEKVRNLLTDTVTLLCKNGLIFSQELRIEGLLGVTVDNKESFYVHIGETFGPTGDRLDRDPNTGETVRQKEKPKAKKLTRSDDDSRPSPSPKSTSRPSSHSGHSAASSPSHVRVKNEPDDNGGGSCAFMDSKSFKRGVPHGGEGEPPTKRRGMVGDGMDGSFGTGMAPGQNQWQQLAAQVATSDNPMAMIESLPGSSSWQSPVSGQMAAAAQIAGTPTQSTSDMVR